MLCNCRQLLQLVADGNVHNDDCKSYASSYDQHSNTHECQVHAFMTLDPAYLESLARDIWGYRFTQYHQIDQNDTVVVNSRHTRCATSSAGKSSNSHHRVVANLPLPRALNSTLLSSII